MPRQNIAEIEIRIVGYRKTLRIMKQICKQSGRLARSLTAVARATDEASKILRMPVRI